MIRAGACSGGSTLACVLAFVFVLCCLPSEVLCVPVLYVGSLRFNFSSPVARIGDQSVALQLGTGAAQYLVYMNGTGLVSPTVTYGLVGDSGRFNCDLDAASRLPEMIVCKTQPNSVGLWNVFRVVSGPDTAEVRTYAGTLIPAPFTSTPQQIAWDTINFFNKPVITSVSGCTIGNPVETTTDCLAAGGQTLTIRGTSLYQPSLVSVGGYECSSVNHCPNVFDGTCLQCTLPAATGVGKAVQVSMLSTLAVDTINRVSDTFPNSVSYQRPIIDAVSGCTDVAAIDGALPTTIACSRLGGDIITLTGRNFQGATGNTAQVLVGGKLALGVVTTDSQITFINPDGDGDLRSVLVLQQAGLISIAPATLSYEQCAPGTRLNSTVGFVCIQCPAGTFSATSDAKDCVACAPGRAAPAGSETCGFCPAGSFNRDADRVNCTLCGIGEFQPASGQPNCFACPAGKFSSVPGARLCEDCPKDTFSQANTTGVVTGATSCTACEGITYSEQTGSTVCITCPAGQYWNRAIRFCDECPLGAQCTNEGITSIDNFYVYVDDDLSVRSNPCLPGFCTGCDVPGPDGRNAARTQQIAGQVYSCCTTNRPPASVNPLCGACLDGYTVYGGACVECESANGGILFGLLVMQWVYVTIFHVFAQIDNADLRIFLNFIQFVFLFLSTQASSLTSWLALFNFNFFTSISTQCVAPIDDLTSLASGLYVPLIGLGLLIANIGIHYLIWRLLRRTQYCRYSCCTERPPEDTGSVLAPSEICRDFFVELRAVDSFWIIWNRYRRTFIGFVANSYASFGQAVFMFFSCIRIGDDHFIQAYPSVSCDHDPKYARLRPIFILVTLILVALPVGIGLRLYQLNRAGLLFGRKDVRLVYGALIESYAPSKYAWECWVLIRRLIVAAVALVTYTNDLPQKFTFLTLCNIMFLGIHYFARPYALPIDNYAESLSLIVLTIVTLFLIHAPNPLSNSYAAGLTALSFFIAFLFGVRIFFARTESLYHAKKRAEEKRKADAARAAFGSGDYSDALKGDLVNDEDFYEEEAKRAAAERMSTVSRPSTSPLPSPHADARKLTTDSVRSAIVDPGQRAKPVREATLHDDVLDGEMMEGAFVGNDDLDAVPEPTDGDTPAGAPASGKPKVKPAGSAAHLELSAIDVKVDRENVQPPPPPAARTPVASATPAPVPAEATRAAAADATPASPDAISEIAASRAAVGAVSMRAAPPALPPTPPTASSSAAAKAKPPLPPPPPPAPKR